MTKQWKIYILIPRSEDETDQLILEPYWPSREPFDSFEEAETVLDATKDCQETLTILPIFT